MFFLNLLLETFSFSNCTLVLRSLDARRRLTSGERLVSLAATRAPGHRVRLSAAVHDSSMLIESFVP